MCAVLRVREVRPGERVPRGHYVAVSEDGATRREVFGGPAFRERLLSRRRLRVVWSHAWRWLLLAAVVAGLRWL